METLQTRLDSYWKHFNEFRENIGKYRNEMVDHLEGDNDFIFLNLLDINIYELQKVLLLTLKNTCKNDDYVSGIISQFHQTNQNMPVK